MSIGKDVWVLMLAFALCLGGGACWYFTGKHEARLANETTVTSNWKRVDAKSLKWTVDKLPGRVPSMVWTVEYDYMVDGALYKGHHISVGLTALRVGYGDYPIDMTVRLNEIRSVWYDPKTPSHSAVFKSQGADVGSGLREEYNALTAQAKREGRWP